ncbi:MAG: methylenetetrahydrofolate reductase C-terminal domain-containing protein [Candidatus Aminicenantes bacterium]|nr:methylenetetrahydrofolate reductase C-terminal domain-containing protein [Candidatus Aminicenantes bacterium]
MDRISLQTRLAARGQAPQGKRPFLVLAELVPESGHSLRGIRAFLESAAGAADRLPAGCELAGVTIPQSPNGVASLSPADVFAVLDKQDLWGSLDVVPHVSAKDHNAEALKSYLCGLRALGLDSVLALTGDKPASAQGVFEVDAIGLLGLIRDINHASWAAAPLGRFEGVPQFMAMAAVSPFKYTEASQLQQYFKMKKKLRAGAGALITQMGWDSRKSEELFRYLGEEGIDVPVFGNVYFLTARNSSPRLMAEGKLPGCYVSRALFNAVSKESAADTIERAALQTAMYKDLGAAGVDLGGFPDFETLPAILQRAEEIGSDWRNRRDRLDFGPGRVVDGSPTYYLYDEEGCRRSVSRPQATAGKRMFDLTHRTLMTPGRGAYPAVKAVLKASASVRRGQGFPYASVYAAEAAAKTLLFDCQECGDCYLPENFGLCTLGRCAKGLSNPPCGDADPRGRCGTNPDRICVGESIFFAAASEGRTGLKRLEALSNADRIPALAHTASIPNYYFGRDHARPRGLIQIGELLHGSIPKTAAAMAEVLATGEGGLDRPGGARNYLLSLIKAQIQHKADYIDVNVDAFGGSDLEFRKRMMVDYVRFIRTSAEGLPVCVDSGSPEVLEAGLAAWYDGAASGLAVPLVNAVKTYTMDRLLPLRSRFAFKFIGMLVDEKHAGHEGVYSFAELHEMARQLVQAAVANGFRPADIFIDSTVFPLAIDMPMAPDTPGYTYRTFETIRRVKRDPALRGVHLSLGVTNAVRDLPGRRTGVCRAYLAIARRCGLDAAIVNVMHDYEDHPAAPELTTFVDAFARQDGSPQAGQRAIDAMMEFCRTNRKKRS